MDSAEKNIKRFILNKFKSDIDANNEILPVCWIDDLIIRLSMYEKDFFYRAIEELIQAGLVEQVNDKGLYSGFKLTQKGEDLVYTS